MRFKLMGCVMAATLAFAGGACAGDVHFGDGNCGYTSDYDVHASQDGVDFRRDSGRPTQVFMHDGRLWVDGRDVAVSADDATRLRAYESQLRGLLPEIASIARQGVDMGFAAMRTVLLTFADNDDERRGMLRRLDDNHRQALARIDASLGQGVWQRHAMDDMVADSVQASVSDLAGKVAGSAVKAALSGDESKVAALQARAESLDQSMDREMSRQAEQLDKRAEALCPRLVALDHLQQQLQVRLQDGARLQLLSHDADHARKLTTAQARAHAE
ncbi:DUF2884 family protein [Dyella soli]|nr:DUF2884 family protein [Dyella soli]